jgi:hypothetical protein
MSAPPTLGEQAEKLFAPYIERRRAEDEAKQMKFEMMMNTVSNKIATAFQAALAEPMMNDKGDTIMFSTLLTDAEFTWATEVPWCHVVATTKRTKLITTNPNMKLRFCGCSYLPVTLEVKCRFELSIHC